MEEYKPVCTEFYIFLLTEFPRQTQKHLPGPWISVTPTVHKLLAHSWELMAPVVSETWMSLDWNGMINFSRPSGQSFRERRVKSKTCKTQTECGSSLTRLSTRNDVKLIHSANTAKFVVTPLDIVRKRICSLELCRKRTLRDHS